MKEGRNNKVKKKDEKKEPKLKKTLRNLMSLGGNKD
jgi:hypothetical protein